MENNIYYEEDKIGRHKVIEQPNGIKIRLLKEPSEWYKEKKKKKADEERARKAIADEAKARESLIKQRMRDIAEQQLISEGVIEAEK